MADWRFVLADVNFVPVGEILNASERKVAIPLSKFDTLSFRVRLDNPLTDPLMTTAGFIKGYRNGVPRFFGPIVSAEEAGDNTGATAAINAVGAGWMFQKRIVGKSAQGTPFTSLTDRAVIAGTLLTTADSEGATGISIDAGNSAASAVTYLAGPYKTLYDTVTELAAGFDGFDWRVLPIDNYAAGAVTGSKIGLFYARPLIGTPQPEAVFEWGTGRRNIASYTRTVSRDTQANKVYHIASPGPDAPGYPVISAIDPTSISNYGLLEDLAQADLLDAGMRTQLVEEHIRVRSTPRQIIQFTPHIDPGNTGRLPNYGVDYDVGDTVRARIAFEGVTRVDAAVRVWGVTFDIDSNGVERTSTVLAEE